jgi:D-alanine-D-alanine ligase
VVRGRVEPESLLSAAPTIFLLILLLVPPLCFSGFVAMHAVVFWNQVSLQDSAADLDVLVQCVEIETGLRNLGFTVERVPCTLNLEEARNRLIQARPDVVFNLVEALGGTDQLTSLAILLLESLHLKFTGAGCFDNMLAAVKTTIKPRLLELQLPTPAWISSAVPKWQGSGLAGRYPTKVIVKSTSEHASFALQDDCIFSIPSGPEGTASLLQRLQQQSRRYNRVFFAEEYIDGREFHVGVLSEAGVPLVLPPSEIQFIDFPDEKPKIFGANAKWECESREYGATDRTFEFPQSDQVLLERLTSTARDCWMKCGFRGYGRIDFRVDASGQPWIVDINLNPRLTPGSCFGAALAELGVSFDEVLRRIVDEAMR